MGMVELANFIGATYSAWQTCERIKEVKLLFCRDGNVADLSARLDGLDTWPQLAHVGRTTETKLSRSFQWPRTQDENLHQSPRALLPVRAGRDIGDTDKSP